MICIGIIEIILMDGVAIGVLKQEVPDLLGGLQDGNIKIIFIQVKDLDLNSLLSLILLQIFIVKKVLIHGQMVIY